MSRPSIFSSVDFLPSGKVRVVLNTTVTTAIGLKIFEALAADEAEQAASAKTLTFRPRRLAQRTVKRPKKNAQLIRRIAGARPRSNAHGASKRSVPATPL
jgi:hypothetical protein